MDEQQTTLDGFTQTATPEKKIRKPKTASAPRPSAADEGQIISYRHLDRRKNNPEVGVVNASTDPEAPKTVWNYDPHLDPALQFDNSRANIETLIDNALASGNEVEMRAALEELKRLQAPYLNWTGKAERTSFEVDTVSLHVHERMDPMSILAAVRKQMKNSKAGKITQPGLFEAPFESLPLRDAIDFYKHDRGWANRLVTGDSLLVMNSLLQKEGMAGQVQMIYLDPPYGIKFASNFQPEVGQRDVKDKDSDLTREPEMVRAYRDTWTLGVHSYLAYLRDRLMIAKELLADSGSIFVQISDENLHRLRLVMDEVFGIENFVSQIQAQKTGTQTGEFLVQNSDFVLWYGKDKKKVKFFQLFVDRKNDRLRGSDEDSDGWSPDPITSDGFRKTTTVDFPFQGQVFHPGANRHWGVDTSDLERAAKADRIVRLQSQIRFKKFFDDYPVTPIGPTWTDVGGATNKVYVVQTATKVIERCLLMTTDPGDLVLDPTCGSGTTAYVAEQWGRRWITCDTSRVALSLARQRLMTAKFDYYALRAISDEDQARNPEGAWLKEPTSGEARTLDCKTVPHVTLRSIAQNADLDPIFAKHEPLLEAALAACNAALAEVTPDLRASLKAKLLAKERSEGKRTVTDADRRRWLLPPDGRDRSAEAKKRASVDLEATGWYAWEVPFDTDEDWPQPLREAVTAYRAAWRAKMDEVDACIAANVAQEELVDQAKVVRGITRVSGPFTVESVLPALESLEVDSPIEGAEGDLPAFDPGTAPENAEAFQEQVLGWLRRQGVDFLDNKRQDFTRLEPLTGQAVLHGQGAWGEPERRVAVSIGPRIGNVSEFQVAQALRLAYQRGFQELVFAGFGFDAVAQGAIQAHAQEGGEVRTHLLLIRPDVAMSGLLREGPGAQLFTAMGLPRTRLERLKGGEYRVHMEGVDVYNPVDHSLTDTRADKVAAWFVDQDYDGRAFCISQAFFPDKTAWEKLAKALKSADAERFKAFAGTESLPFTAGKYRRCAVKVVDLRGNEVMATHNLEAEGDRA